MARNNVTLKLSLQTDLQATVKEIRRELAGLRSDFKSLDVSKGLSSGLDQEILRIKKGFGSLGISIKRTFVSVSKRAATSLRSGVVGGLDKVSAGLDKIVSRNAGVLEGFKAQKGALARAADEIQRAQALRSRTATLRASQLPSQGILAVRTNTLPPEVKSALELIAEFKRGGAIPFGEKGKQGVDTFRKAFILLDKELLLSQSRIGKLIRLFSLQRPRQGVNNLKDRVSKLTINLKELGIRGRQAFDLLTGAVRFTTSVSLRLVRTYAKLVKGAFQIARGVTRIILRSGGLQRVARSLGNIARGIFRSIFSFSRLRLILVGLSAGVLGGLVRAITRVTAKFEVFRNQLKGIIQDNIKAEATFERIRDFAAALPLTTEETVSAFVRLRAVGIKAAEEVTGILANVALAFNRDLRDVASAFIGVETEVLRRLGFLLIRTGSKALITFRGVRTTVNNDIESIREALLRLLKEQLPNLTTLVSNSITGQFAVMKSLIQEVGADIGEAFRPGLLIGLRDVNEFISSIRPTIRSVSTLFVEEFDTVGEIISNFFEDLRNEILGVPSEKFSKLMEGIFDILKVTLDTSVALVVLVGSIIWLPIESGFNIMIARVARKFRLFFADTLTSLPMEKNDSFLSFLKGEGTVRTRFRSGETVSLEGRFSSLRRDIERTVNNILTEAGQTTKIEIPTDQKIAIQGLVDFIIESVQSTRQSPVSARRGGVLAGIGPGKVSEATRASLRKLLLEQINLAGFGKGLDLLDDVKIKEAQALGDATRKAVLTADALLVIFRENLKKTVVAAEKIGAGAIGAFGGSLGAAAGRANRTFQNAVERIDLKLALREAEKAFKFIEARSSGKLGLEIDFNFKRLSGASEVLKKELIRLSNIRQATGTFNGIVEQFNRVRQALIVVEDVFSIQIKKSNSQVEENLKNFKTLQSEFFSESAGDKAATSLIRFNKVFREQITAFVTSSSDFTTLTKTGGLKKSIRTLATSNTEAGDKFLFSFSKARAAELLKNDPKLGNQLLEAADAAAGGSLKRLLKRLTIETIKTRGDAITALTATRGEITKKGRETEGFLKASNRVLLDSTLQNLNLPGKLRLLNEQLQGAIKDEFKNFITRPTGEKGVLNLKILRGRLDQARREFISFVESPVFTKAFRPKLLEDFLKKIPVRFKETFSKIAASFSNTSLLKSLDDLIRTILTGLPKADQSAFKLARSLMRVEEVKVGQKIKRMIGLIERNFPSLSLKVKELVASFEKKGSKGTPEELRRKLKALVEEGKRANFIGRETKERRFERLPNIPSTKRQEFLAFAKRTKGEIEDIQLQFFGDPAKDQFTSFTDGAQVALDDLRAGFFDLAADGKRFISGLAGSIANNLTSSLLSIVDGTKSAKEAFSAFAKAVLIDIARMIIQLAVFKAVQFGLGFAFGGPVGGGAAVVAGSAVSGAAGGVASRKFADGGIVSRPTVALFGESGPEAFIPLKKGRVPVSVKGGDASSSPIIGTLIIQATDADSFRRRLDSDREFLAAAIAVQLSRSPRDAQNFRRALGR